VLSLNLTEYAAVDYLDHQKLDGLDSGNFRRRTPYPWLNPEGLIRDAAYRKLLDNLPDIALFEKRFGYSRDYGQKGHDRYTLEYDSHLNIAPCWHEFIQELRGSHYRGFLRKLYGFRPMKLSFHWHYTPHGCAVNPHCDSKVKIGSHIFYLNTDKDWKTEWGGQTLILDDHGQIDSKSAPEFDIFKAPIPANSIGNHSLLFKRTPHSWHGVKAVNCPEDRLRKVFIVAYRRVRPFRFAQNLFRKSA